MIRLPHIGYPLGTGSSKNQSITEHCTASALTHKGKLANTKRSCLPMRYSWETSKMLVQLSQHILLPEGPRGYTDRARGNNHWTLNASFNRRYSRVHHSDAKTTLYSIQQNISTRAIRVVFLGPVTNYQSCSLIGIKRCSVCVGRSYCPYRNQSTYGFSNTKIRCVCVTKYISRGYSR